MTKYDDDGNMLFVETSKQIGGTHYVNMQVQPWAAMQAWMTPDEFKGYLRGNVIKYIARAGHKDACLQDLQKAMHYLEKLLEVTLKIKNA